MADGRPVQRPQEEREGGEKGHEDDPRTSPGTVVVAHFWGPAMGRT